MMTLLPLLAAVAVSLIAACAGARLLTWSLAAAIAIVAVGYAAGVTDAGWITFAVFALLVLPLNLAPLRRALISAPLLNVFRRVMPTLSDTEQTALAAGTVGFEG